MGAIKKKNNLPTWGDNSHLVSYMPYSETEKQVYLQGSKISMLTNHRLIEITQLRPIDKLYNLLASMQESDMAFERFHDDFLDFAHMYSLEETCTMLVQIITDQ